MSELQKAAKAIDDYASHAANDGVYGSITVPIRLLQDLRKALKKEEK